MDWKKTLGALAPTLATALGGPLAGGAVKFLAGELLGDENATEQELGDYVLGASAEDLAKIKKVDNDYDVRMKELDIDVVKISVENTKSAREMAKINMLPQIMLSILFVVGYFAIMLMMFTNYISPSESMKDPLLVLLGVMTREMPTIMQFWFGSSFGSKNKTEHLSMK